MSSETQKFSDRALKKGAKLFTEEHAIKRLQGLYDWDPGFGKLFEDFIYGGMYDRNVLDDKCRELCAIAALTVLGRMGQLRAHVRAALRSGATRQEVLEVILQMCVYGGMPVTLTALDHLKEIFATEQP